MAKTSRIALTLGEPAGIGVDLCLQLSATNHPCQLVMIGSRQLLEQRAKMLDCTVNIQDWTADTPVTSSQKGVLTLLDIALFAPVVCGKINIANSRYVIAIIERAVQGCMDGIFAAMVTAPVHKAALCDAGISFTGHTEYIAKLTGGYPVMVLATGDLRVALLTTHIPLAEVPSRITATRLQEVIAKLHQGLKLQFAIAKPRIAVCGLNPHAGEDGHLGSEDGEIIAPVISRLRQQGIEVHGPLPADTIFTPKQLAQCDVVLAMYHDQGLPVLKAIGFGGAVNITLGLPIIRTSVDHGTALDLAGTGTADVGSLKAAVQTAVQLATQQQK